MILEKKNKCKIMDIVCMECKTTNVKEYFDIYVWALLKYKVNNLILFYNNLILISI